MIHTLIFQEETATDAVFVCSACGKVIGFNKDGVGEPCATFDGMNWITPENADEYLGECA